MSIFDDLEKKLKMLVIKVYKRHGKYPKYHK